MTGVSERLTSANDALRGYPGLRLWLIARIGASICITSCLYQVHEEIINVNASFSCQTI
jgi:hypothetical protein